MISASLSVPQAEIPAPAQPSLLPRPERGPIPYVMSNAICGLCRIRYLTKSVSCVCEEESVMGRFDFRDCGPLRSQNLQPAFPVKEREPEPELPIGQKIVLLKLRKGELAAKILDHLREMSVPEPVKADWSAMIEARYIRRDYSDVATGRLVMMPAGLSKCHAIMKDLAQKFSIHQFMRSGGRGSGLVSQCSCGWRSGYARDSRGGQSKLNSSESWHIRQVESGRWKPIEEQRADHEQRLTDFYNTHAPPRLPLERRDIQ